MFCKKYYPVFLTITSGYYPADLIKILVQLTHWIVKGVTEKKAIF